MTPTTAILNELIIADCAALVAVLQFSWGKPHFGWAFLVAALFGVASAIAIMLMGNSTSIDGLMIKRGHVASVQHPCHSRNTHCDAS